MAKRKIREKYAKLGKFYVNFDYGDPDELEKLLEENPMAEDEYNEAHTYHNEIKLNCSEDEYYEFLDNHEDEIRALETQYGVLDGEGMSNDMGSVDMGYSSYEISLKNAPVVWHKLVTMLREANLLAQ